MPQYPRVVKRLSPVLCTIVILPSCVLADDARLRRHVEGLAAQSGCEHRIEYAATRHVYVTPSGDWHIVHLWRDIAQHCVSGEVVALDWCARLVMVESEHGRLALDIAAFEPDGGDSLHVGAYVELLWTIHEEVSGMVDDKLVD